MSKKIVFISGNFNILHPGHIRLFKYAHECGEKLIVGVNSDKIAGSAAYVSEDLRLDSIKANSLVDESFIIDEPIVELIKTIKPNIVIKGKEYEDKFNPEEEALRDFGGRLYFSSGESSFSSLDLMNKEVLLAKNKLLNVPSLFLKRHNIHQERIRGLINSFEKIRVCIIGDLIVDEYISCSALGMSQEDPTIVLAPTETIKYLGGAGIVAGHAAGLGSKVTFITVYGDDEAGRFALQNLSELGVNTAFLLDETRPTTLKQRFRSKGKTLMRLSYLHQTSISKTLQGKILTKLKLLAPEIDLILFSDFNYGCLPQELVEEITQLGKDNGILMAADSQSSSQIGNISRFKNMDLLTPTEYEARIALRDRDVGLPVLVENLRRESLGKKILLKMGDDGLLVHGEEVRDSVKSFYTDRVPALNKMPIDVAGAGDSMLVAASLAMVSKATIWEMAYLGSLIAAIQISRVGNTPINVSEVIAALEN